MGKHYIITEKELEELTDSDFWRPYLERIEAREIVLKPGTEKCWVYMGVGKYNG